MVKVNGGHCHLTVLTFEKCHPSSLNCLSRFLTMNVFRSLKIDLVSIEGRCQIIRYMIGYYGQLRPHQYNGRLTPMNRKNYIEKTLKP